MEAQHIAIEPMGHAQEKKSSSSSKTLGLLLQFVILVGAFYDAIEFIKPEVSTANLNVIDLLLAAVYLVWLFLVIRGKIGLPRLSRNKTLYLFILMLLVPILVGFMQDHVWQTVLRDARAPYYFVLSLVVISYANDENAFKRLLSTFLVVGSICLVLDYLVFIFKIPIATSLNFTLLTTGRATRYFGYHSSHVLLLVCIMLLINYLFISRAKMSTKVIAFVGLFAFVVGLGLTLIRGLFIGMIFGSFVSVIVQKDKKKVVAVSAVGLVLASLVALFLLTSPEAMTTVVRIPMVERYMSILDPSASSQEAVNTAKARMDAIPSVMKAIREHQLLGMGYGEYRRARDEADVIDPVLPSLGHSAPSYMLYRTGYVGAFVLLFCLIVFFARGFRSFVKSRTGTTLQLVYLTACASFVGMCAASLGSNMIYGADRFSPLVAIILGLLLSRVRRAETNRSLGNAQREEKPSWILAAPRSP
jgi:O-antigen ligase